MSNRKEKNFLKKKRQHDKENAEEPNEEINEALNDDFTLSKKTYIFPENCLFTEPKEDSLKPYLKGNDFAKNKRSDKRLPNFQQKHYIRVNIKRTFMNNYLIGALNEKLIKNGFTTFFSKFPQSFANNVTKDKCKILIDMRLKDIFRDEELYEHIKNKNFEHNLKIVDEIEKKGNPELNMILNKKLCCLFKEYINSEEFGKIELNRLKKEKDEYYIKKYVYLAKEFIEFIFSTEK